MGKRQTGRRHRGRWALLSVVLLVVIIALASSGGGKSHSLPSGQWGKLISCMESHPLFNVYDAYSTNANAPNASTKALDIWQTLKGVSLAYVGDNALGADDLTGSGDANVNLTDGPIHYGFTPQAGSSDKYAITTCITGAYGS